jgi:hypothetical protein
MNFCFDSVVKKMIHLYDEVNNFKSLTLSFSKGIKLVKKNPYNQKKQQCQ